MSARGALLAALAVASTTPAQEPLLHATATEARWLAPFAEALGVTLPELPADACLVLHVGADGVAVVTTPRAAAGATLLDVEVHAAAWLQRGGDAVAHGKRALMNRAAGFAGLAGLPARAGADLVEGLFAVVQSTDVARMSVRAPAGERDYTIGIELVPAADSPFAKWLAAPAAAPVTAPVLPWDDAMLRLGISLRAQCLRDVTAPFLPFVAAVAGTPVADVGKRVDLLDGTFAVTLAPARLGVAYGLRDAAAFVARTTDPALLQQEIEALARNDVTAEFMPDAERYRDVALLRSRATGRSPLPGLAGEDGALVSFGGCAAEMWLQVAGSGARESVRGAIDAALAGRLRAPFPAATNAPSPWLTLDLDLARLALALAATAPAPAPAEQPTEQAPAAALRRLHLQVSSSPRSLLARVDLR